MRKGLMVKLIVLFSLFYLLTGLSAFAQEAEEKTSSGFQSLLIICPFTEMVKQQLIEDAFVQAFAKITPAEGIFSYMGSLAKGEKIPREEFIRRVNEKKIEVLLYIQVQGISSDMDSLGGAPDPFSPSSDADEPDEGGFYAGRPRPAKTWYQASLVDFKTGKPVWKETLMVLGDVGFSLKNVAQSMAKKTAKQLKKTKLLKAK